MNELIELVDHIHNITSSILLKYYKGIELTDSEDEVLSDLFIAKSEDKLKSIENIPITENKHLKNLIMPKGVKNNTVVKPEIKGSISLDMEILNMSGKVVSTGSPVYIEVAKLIEKGVSITDVHTYCIQKSNDHYLTIKEVLKTSVVNAETDPKKPGEKFENYKLAMKIESGNSDFTDEERILIKKSVELFWGTEVVGFVWTTFNFK